MGRCDMSLRSDEDSCSRGGRIDEGAYGAAGVQGILQVKACKQQAHTTWLTFVGGRFLLLPESEPGPAAP